MKRIELVKKINTWDKKNVHTLLSYIRELNEICESESGPNAFSIDQEIAFSDLPTIDIPSEIDTSYPVWAMDVNKDCLVGSGVDMEIESLEEVRASQEGLQEDIKRTSRDRLYLGSIT